jgi:ElaB/YqjD/DUF883 family membrane-anchored ribosome-binding protein
MSTMNQISPSSNDPQSTDAQSTGDVQKAIRRAEDMFNQAATAGGERANELRERAMEQLRVLRERLADAQESVVARGRVAARVTDDYVHDHPWKAIATAGAIGVVVGLLLNRR